MPILAWFVWDMTAVMMLLYQHSYADHDRWGGWFDTYVVMLNMNFHLPFPVVSKKYNNHTQRLTMLVSWLPLNRHLPPSRIL
jgi:hypothetical protein